MRILHFSAVELRCNAVSCLSLHYLSHTTCSYLIICVHLCEKVNVITCVSVNCLIARQSLVFVCAARSRYLYCVRLSSFSDELRGERKSFAFTSTASLLPVQTECKNTIPSAVREVNVFMRYSQSSLAVLFYMHFTVLSKRPIMHITWSQ